MHTNHPSDLLTADEVGQRIKVRPSTVLTWSRRGRIPALRISPKVLRFRLADVLAALEGRQEAAGQRGGQ